MTLPSQKPSIFPNSIYKMFKGIKNILKKIYCHKKSDLSSTENTLYSKIT